LSTNYHQKLGVSSGDIEVIVHNGHRRHNFVKKFLTTMPRLPFRKLNSDLKFSHGDSGDRHIDLVTNRVIKISVGPLGID
jgi:hypothetical protein